MPINFDQIKSLTIPEGSVISITDSHGNRLWPYVEPYYVVFTSPGNISLNVVDNIKYWNGTIETSTDNSTWTVWNGTTTVTSTTGKLYVRGSNNTFITGENASSTKAAWNLTGSNITVGGNIECLLDYQTVISGNIPTAANYTFSHLLCYNSNLISAHRLVLPRTILKAHMYDWLFLQTGITTAPALPATTLAAECYRGMFSVCSNLATAPALPATTLADSCYNSMFNGCTSLVISPALPATTLAKGCYYSMFKGCTNLTTINALPATTLAVECYREMYYNCSKIKLAYSQSSSYPNAYRIPIERVGTSAGAATANMVWGTGGVIPNDGGSPSINTTYYTSNTII